MQPPTTSGRTVEYEALTKLSLGISTEIFEKPKKKPGRPRITTIEAIELAQPQREVTIKLKYLGRAIDAIRELRDMLERGWRRPKVGQAIGKTLG